MLTIREATLSDTNLLSSLGRKTFEDAFAKDNKPENMKAYLQKSFNKKKIIQEITDPDTKFYLAFEEDQPAGYAKLRENAEVKKVLKERAIELERIYVDIGFQGKKVGASLLQTCETHARENGFHWIWLGVWEYNHKAQNFYAKWGFEKFGEHIFQMGDDPQTDWIMKKEVRESY